MNTQAYIPNNFNHILMYLIMEFLYNTAACRW